MYSGKRIGASRRMRVRNKASAEIRFLCLDLAPKALDHLGELIASPDEKVAIRTVSLVLAYAYGKLREHVEMAEDSVPLEFTLDLGQLPPMRQLDHVEGQKKVMSGYMGRMPRRLNIERTVWCQHQWI